MIKASTLQEDIAILMCMHLTTVSKYKRFWATMAGCSGPATIPSYGVSLPSSAPGMPFLASVTTPHATLNTDRSVSSLFTF